MQRLGSIRTALGSLMIAVYLSFIGYAAVQQLRGDSAASPALYFATWDMFPFYDTESVRRIVIARDASGQWWQLAPGPMDRFRWGVYGQATRYDLDRRPDVMERCAQSAVSQAASAANAGSAAELQEVLVAERYWPVRQNRFGSEGAGRSTEPFSVPRSMPWRIVGRGRVEAGGRIDWGPHP